MNCHGIVVAIIRFWWFNLVSEQQGEKIESLCKSYHENKKASTK